MSNPAGWYDDGSGRQRWWDGTQWTDQFAAPATTAAPAPATVAEPVATSRPKKPHVLSYIALGVAAVGFIFACIPGALVVGWILLPIAFILAIVALFLQGAKWPAITGLIVAIVGTIVGFIVFFSLLATAASEAFNDAPAPNGPVATEEAESEAVEPDATADSDYGVTIDGGTKGEDYEGKPALLVAYTFTNNSDKDANFMFATSAKAFQNGVELESAVMLDDLEGLKNALKDVKPGASISLQLAYVLDDTSDVTVEVTELISFDDAKIASKVISLK